MARLRIKSPGQKLQVKARLSFGERWNRKEENFLTSSSLPGFLRLESVTARSAMFSAAADMTLDAYMRSGIDGEMFYRLLVQLVNVQQQVDKNSLSMANLQLDPRWIFVNCNLKQIYFLYQPLDQPGAIPSTHALLERIAAAAVGHGTEPVAIEELRRLLSASGVVKNLDLEKIVLRYRPEQHRDFLYPQIKDHGRRRKGTVMMDDDTDGWGGTMVMDDETSYLEGTTMLDEDDYAFDSGATTVLQKREPVLRPMLCRVRTGESAEITKDVFRIGKLPGRSDFCVPDNPAVSRSHADIITRGGRFYIYDNDSTNGTYVDQTPVAALQEVEIFDGSALRLADEDFQFNIIRE